MLYCSTARLSNLTVKNKSKLYNQIKVCSKIIGHPVAQAFQEAHNNSMLRLATNISSDCMHTCPEQWISAPAFKIGISETINSTEIDLKLLCTSVHCITEQTKMTFPEHFLIPYQSSYDLVKLPYLSLVVCVLCWLCHVMSCVCTCVFPVNTCACLICHLCCLCIAVLSCHVSFLPVYLYVLNVLRGPPSDAKLISMPYWQIKKYRIIYLRLLKWDRFFNSK